RTGAVFIADEVQSGSGRTGRMWAIEHSGVVPDLIVSAKSLGAGMPISAVTGRAEILDAPHVGGVGSTYGGNPLAAVAALSAFRFTNSNTNSGQ
ncbi:aminotransferase class III-fold pyridoxal phosphate-dependent enzyme, partial [Escherichia coli]|nr:aminotransferase class III-fold pyridoxal phosphate-dependent enzyme [Escherichia coli]